MLQFLMSRDRDELMLVALALLDMSGLEGQTDKCAKAKDWAKVQW